MESEKYLLNFFSKSYKMWKCIILLNLWSNDIIEFRKRKTMTFSQPQGNRLLL